MADRLTPEQRRLNMSRIRAQNTAPEILVRRRLHAMGFRFRLHRRDLPGKPDLVLPKHKVAVFVHGCFWHGHECDQFRWPSTRLDYWRPKILGNKERDKQAIAALIAAGWRVIVIWECALKGPHRLSGDAFQVLVQQAIHFAEPECSLTGGAHDIRSEGPAENGDKDPSHPPT